MTCYKCYLRQLIRKIGNVLRGRFMFWLLCAVNCNLSLFCWSIKETLCLRKTIISDYSTHRNKHDNRKEITLLFFLGKKQKNDTSVFCLRAETEEEEKQSMIAVFSSGFLFTRFILANERKQYSFEIVGTVEWNIFIFRHQSQLHSAGIRQMDFDVPNPNLSDHLHVPTTWLFFLESHRKYFTQFFGGKEDFNIDLNSFSQIRLISVFEKNWLAKNLKCIGFKRLVLAHQNTS